MHASLTIGAFAAFFATFHLWCFFFFLSHQSLTKQATAATTVAATASSSAVKPQASPLTTSAKVNPAAASTNPTSSVSATTAAVAEPAAAAAASAAAPVIRAPAHPKLTGYWSKIDSVIDTVVRETTGPLDGNGWTFNSRQKEIDIYTKKIGDVNLSKGVGIIPFPPLLVHHIFTDLTIRKQWDEMFESGSVIEVIDEVCDDAMMYAHIRRVVVSLVDSLCVMTC
jgi:hypothetical protein